MVEMPAVIRNGSGTTAERRVDPLNVVTSGKPFQVTYAVGAKLRPVTVSVTFRAFSAAELGDTSVIMGVSTVCAGRVLVSTHDASTTT
jgi:hypothetical protein